LDIGIACHVNWASRRDEGVVDTHHERISTSRIRSQIDVLLRYVTTLDARDVPFYGLVLRGAAMADNATATNQKQILANQRRILANQRKIESNQRKLDRLLRNQKKLDQILVNQKKILSRLP
jgi:hypothetical protein